MTMVSGRNELMFYYYYMYILLYIKELILYLYILHSIGHPDRMISLACSMHKFNTWIKTAKGMIDSSNIYSSIYIKY
jgi:hypothetical protein